MNRALRLILYFLGALCSAAVLLFVAGLAVLQTSWFRNKVRTEVISTIEHATGGRVHLGAFDYDRGKRTAEFKNFVLHGNEARGEAAFFRADSIRIKLELLSVWDRSVDLESVTVKRPQLHVLVRPDGSSNVPEPQTGPFDTKKMVAELLRLKVRRFDFENGSIETNLRRSQLNGYGENLNLVLNYNRAGPQYEASISLRQLKIDSPGLPPILLNLDAQAQLAKQELKIQHLLLTSVSKRSIFEASGAVTNFVHPEVNLNIIARVTLQELAKQVNESGAVDGDLAFTGSAHYAGLQQMRMEGHLVGKRILLRSGIMKPLRFDAESEVLADPNGISFNRLSARAFGSALTGSLSVDRARQFRLNGNVEKVNLQQAVSINGQQLPWSAILSGPVHAQGHITPNLQDLQAQAQLQLSPASGGTPLSGNLDLVYRKADGTVSVQNSLLQSPNTRASISGVWGDSLNLVIDSTGLEDVKPALRLLNAPSSLLSSISVGYAHFDGAVNGAIDKLLIVGNLQATDAHVRGFEWNRIRSHISVAANGADFSALTIDGSVLRAKADGHISLTEWQWDPQNSLRLGVTFQGANMSRLVSLIPNMNLPPINGVASGSLKVNGSLNNPQGAGEFAIDSIDAYGEHLNLTKVSALIAGNEIHVTSGRVQAGPAIIAFSGRYRHAPGSFETGGLEASLDSNGFPIASLGWLRKYEPALNAQLEIHGKVAVSIKPGSIQPGTSDGTAVLRGISVNKVNYGDLLLKAATKNNQLETEVSGNLRDSRIGGRVQIELTGANMVSGSMNFGKLSLFTIASLLNPAQAQSLPLDGELEAAATFAGPLQRPQEIHGVVRITRFEVQPKANIGETKPAALVFRSEGPIELEAANGVASFREFEIRGPETNVKVAGSVPYGAGSSKLALKANGTVDLRLLQLIQPALRSSGQSILAVAIEGTPASPSVNGTLQLSNGSLFSNSLPSGLTAMNGTVKFANDRASIQQLTAESGGGRVSLTGNVNFRGGSSGWVYNLKANAQDVRFRYGGGISITANSDLTLTGTSNSSLVSGNVTVSRVALSESIDAGNLLASVSAPTPAPSNQKDFVTGLRLDVHVESAPNLQVNTSLSRNIGAEVDLRLRGRPDHPSLLGSVSVNQGDVRIFGAKYSINRGQVNFFNPAKIEPVLDLDLQTESRGITVDITVSGSVNKLNINYRSDPPLQPRDIIALLAVGRAPDIASSVPNAQITNDASALQTGANTVLGQAISPVSNRLSKLFGITNIKIDPLVQGITNTPQARLTLEQQISRDITVTYITNLSETSEQIFRFEWALSQHYSVIALRDDNGEFGLDFQYKRRFK